MTSAQVVETSVKTTSNSPSQDNTHPNDHNLLTYDTTPGFKPFTILRKKMKNSPSCVHGLHKTLNVVISRCCFVEDGKEMYQNVKHTGRVLLFCGVVVAFTCGLVILVNQF